MKAHLHRGDLSNRRPCALDPADRDSLGAVPRTLVSQAALP